MSIPQFGLHFRRYAPFKTFGIPSFKGDTRKKWKTVGKFFGVLALIGGVIGGGIWSWLKYQDRPYVVEEYEGIKLGMRPVDVTLLKGEPDDPDEKPKKSETSDRYTLRYIFGETDSDGEYLLIDFSGPTPAEMGVGRVCSFGGYSKLLGLGRFSSEKSVLDMLGEPTNVSIQADGLSKIVSFEQWNVSYIISEGKVKNRCMTTAPITYVDEFGDEPDPENTAQ